MTEAQNPAVEYSRRLLERRKTESRFERQDRQIAGLRLITTIAFVIVGWLSLLRGTLPRLWLLAPALIFVILVIVHERVAQARRRAQKAVEFYEDGLARIEDRWVGRGEPPSYSAAESHLYAADLDIFGEASLFQLLCTARTRSGIETLAAWLSAPAERAEILKRQQAVEELRDRIDLREDLAIIGSDIRSAIHPELMIQWGNSPSLLRPAWIRAVMAVLTAFALSSVLFGLSWSDGQPLWPIAFALEAAVGSIYRSRVRRIAAVVERPERELELFAQILARIERESFSSARLVDLQSGLRTSGVPPSRRIARLARLVDMLAWRQNLLFAPLSVILFWATQICFAIEDWQRRYGPSIGKWMSAAGEFEALCALAGFAYEHPHDPFPEIVESGPLFEGDDLRHPLVPAAQCIPNSVHIGSGRQLLVVSGSNMSGKSTLLRTVGINAVLAFAGATVRAGRLKLSPMAIGATLRVQDSLQAGTSRFYAEIQRIHHIMDLTKGKLPVLFLLDEVLHGTNSHDRAVGAEAIVRGLIERGAIGLVTTHDLALARVADVLGSRAANVHFEDELIDGKMIFDYRMRTGVVQKSNALALMRSVGLEV